MVIPLASPKAVFCFIKNKYKAVRRKLSLSEQLALFGISQSKTDTPIYTDNFNKITILFIIGFILGDGTLFLRLRNSETGSIWLIPTLVLPQLKNKYKYTATRDHFFTILTNFFKSLPLSPLAGLRQVLIPLKRYLYYTATRYFKRAKPSSGIFVQGA